MSRNLPLVVGLVAMAFVSHAVAAVLSFDSSPGFSQVAPMPGDYGHRITSATTTGRAGATYTYGLTQGITPLVAVKHNRPLHYCISGYGDLTGVSWAPAESWSMTLTANPGSSVRLHAFNMAAFAADQTADIKVLDQANKVLFASQATPIDNVKHNTLSFSTPLEGASLTIRFSATGSSVQSNIGIDDITFSQAFGPTAMNTESTTVAPVNTKPLKPLTVRNVGHYAITPWLEPTARIEPGSNYDRMRDLDFTIRNIWVRDQEGIDAAPAYAKAIMDSVYSGLAHSPPKTLIVRIDFWYRDRYQGPLEEMAVYERRMMAALEALEPILDKIHGLSISEENIISDGRPAVLEHMYQVVKRKYPNLRLYQWYTPNTAVPGTYEDVFLSADGWIVDPYSLNDRSYPNGPTIKRYVQKYLITGKPLVFIAPGYNFKNFFDDEPNESWPVPQQGWRAIDEQLDVCLTYNLPVSWYWFYAENDDYAAPNATDSPWFPLEYETDLGNKLTQRIHAWIKQVHALPEDYAGIPEKADRWDNESTLIAASPGRVIIEHDYSQSDFLDLTSGTGFRDLVWNGQDLAVRGYEGRKANVTMLYRIEGGPYDIQLPWVSLKAIVNPSLHGRIVISMSHDRGKTWPVRVESKNVEGMQSIVLDSRPEGWRNGGPFKFVENLWVKIEITGDAGNESSPPARIDDVKLMNRW